MQMVILAGGLATRLGDLSANTPKSMIPVCGRPFIEHQISLVRAAGITDFVLCIGHFGNQIRDHLGTGEKLGVRITYSDEGEHLLGTGGALKKAAPFLEDAFCLMWGDSFLMLDYADIIETFWRRKSKALMVVYRNENKGEKSNVALGRGKVLAYDKWYADHGMKYIDNGLTVVSKQILDRLPGDSVCDIERVFQELAQEGSLDAYETSHCFYEIGSVAGLRDLERFLEMTKE